MLINLQSINRILCFASGITSLTDRKPVAIIGAIFQTQSLEHLFVKYVPVDPVDLTRSLIEMVPEKFLLSSQIKLILISNTIMAGLGIIKLSKLQSTFQTSIIVITNKKPDIESLEKALKHIEDGEQRKSMLESNPKTWIQVPDSRLWALNVDITSDSMLKLISHLQRHGNYPEPLRIANIIARSLPNSFD